MAISLRNEENPPPLNALNPTLPQSTGVSETCQNVTLLEERAQKFLSLSWSNQTLQLTLPIHFGSSEFFYHPTILVDFSNIDPDQGNIEQALIKRLYQALQPFSSQADYLPSSEHNFLSAAFGSGHALAPAKPISLAPPNLDALIDWLRDVLENSVGFVSLKFNNVPEELNQSDAFKNFLNVLNEVSNERFAGQNETEKLPGAQLIVTQANP